MSSLPQLKTKYEQEHKKSSAAAPMSRPPATSTQARVNESAGEVNKLTSAEPGTYPLYHVETFKGNVDYNFRIGVKRQGRVFSIEKEKNADYLSSIEVLIVNQMDALMMQKQDHVNFVLSHLNKLSKELHDTNFLRIKPWYLDGLLYGDARICKELFSFDYDSNPFCFLKLRKPPYNS
ncbi:hypothetical protein DFP72DRAFT_1060798 [Ephemerocybe angulata]|uniref:UTP25 NTP hydrolase-like domain-containing protein n=1 Tax=Ephemerocybe angulata TaxID=980116 RepID=A0A8H6ME71_9AGAR|nr:hypothetical protein DFP72DRAFT_1060798 [Tulosesus angulatus]